jgi:hypothetical protein
MSWIGSLAKTLPKLRTQIQLAGLSVIVAGVLPIHVFAPEQVHAQISAGAIGVCFLLFAQVFSFLPHIPEASRSKLISVLFLAFLVFVLLMVVLTGYFLLDRDPDGVGQGDSGLSGKVPGIVPPKARVEPPIDVKPLPPAEQADSYSVESVLGPGEQTARRNSEPDPLSTTELPPLKGPGRSLGDANSTLIQPSGGGVTSVRTNADEPTTDELPSPWIEENGFEIRISQLALAPGTCLRPVGRGNWTNGEQGVRLRCSGGWVVFDVAPLLKRGDMRVDGFYCLRVENDGGEHRPFKGLPRWESRTYFADGTNIGFRVNETDVVITSDNSRREPFDSRCQSS